MNLRDRVVRLDRVAANQLRPHPENWRTHPDQQVAALDAILGDIGFAGAVIARELDDGSLQIIDGHARAERMGDQKVPVLVTDLDETEARTVLATYDPIGAMAESNGEVLSGLLDKLAPVDDEALNDLLASLDPSGFDLDTTYEPPPKTEQIKTVILSLTTAQHEMMRSTVERLVEGGQADHPDNAHKWSNALWWLCDKHR